MKRLSSTFMHAGLILALICGLVAAKPTVKAIQHNSEGRYIELEDRSMYEVLAADVDEAKDWKPMERVHVNKHRDFMKSITLQNLDTNTSVRVRKVNIK